MIFVDIYRIDKTRGNVDGRPFGAPNVHHECVTNWERERKKETILRKVSWATFHLTLLESFHHCCLSNVKQGQIDSRERQVKRAFNTP